MSLGQRSLLLRCYHFSASIPVANYLTFLVNLPDHCNITRRTYSRQFSSNAPLQKQSPKQVSKLESVKELEIQLSNTLRAEEDALQNVRPWQQLELLPTYDLTQVVKTEKGECLQKEFVFKRKKWDEKRALMDPGVSLLRYPFSPSTPAPEHLEPTQWSEAFKTSRIFLIGTKHDSIKSTHDVRLLMSAVHADFIFLGMNLEQASLLIGSSRVDLLPIFKTECTEQLLKERLTKEGIAADAGSFTRPSIKIRIEKLHILRQYCQKYMSKYSEFRFARESLPSTNLGCAGFVVGLPPEEKIDRLVDMAEEFLIEDILVRLDQNRVPRFGHDQFEKVFGWTRELIEWAEFKESMPFRLRRFPRRTAYLTEDPFKKYSAEFDALIEREFPGIREAMVERQNRQIVRGLHTLMHRGTIEKLGAAKRQNEEKFEPLTVIAIVGHRHVPGICEIWDRPEELFPSFV